MNPTPSREKARVVHASALHEFKASIKRVGFRNSLRLALNRFIDLGFDFYHGFDTAQRVELCDLTIESENIAHGSPYQPTGVLAFRKAMKGASLPRPAVILDFGCGKGRVLILAAMAGVEKITGIEFSSELCRTARQNLARLQARRPQLKCDCRVVCGDVTGYSYTDDENIFYFFYSFDDCIMKKVITAIEESLKQNPREALIIDFNPFSVLRESTLLKHEKSIDIYGYQCNYYRHIP